MRSITPFLWYDHDLDEVLAHYREVFDDVVVHATTTLPDGNTMVAEFELAGQRFQAINGGPHFHHTEAFSIVVECDDQAEVDRYWSALTADGGEESMCGWLKDRFGLSWQIVPTQFLEMIRDPDPERVGRVMAAMQDMRKLDVAALQAAYG